MEPGDSVPCYADDEVAVGIRWRRLRTAALFCSYLALGSVTLLGPALMDLAVRYSVSVQTVAIAPTLNEVGALAGALLCGFLYSTSTVELLLCVCVAAAGSSMATCLLAPTFPAFMVIYLCVTISCGLLDAAGQSYCLFLWQGHRFSDSVQQSLRAVWSVGAMLTPVVMGPFLATDLSADHPGRNGTRSQIPYAGQMELAFLCLGCVWGLPTVAFAASYVAMSTNKPDDPEPRPILPKRKSSELCNSAPRWAALTLTAAVGAVLLFSVEAATTAYLPAHLLLARNWTSPEAASVQGVFFGSQLSGRLAAIFLSMKVPAVALLAGSEVLLLLGAGLLLLRWWLVPWVSAVLLGMGSSCLRPVLLLWLSKRVILSNRLHSFMLGSINIGTVGIYGLLGYLLDRVTPWGFVYVLLACCCLHPVFYVLLAAISAWHFPKPGDGDEEKPQDASLIRRTSDTVVEKVSFDLTYG